MSHAVVSLRSNDLMRTPPSVHFELPHTVSAGLTGSGPYIASTCEYGPSIFHVHSFANRVSLALWNANFIVVLYKCGVMPHQYLADRCRNRLDVTHDRVVGIRGLLWCGCLGDAVLHHTLRTKGHQGTVQLVGLTQNEF